MRDKALSTVLCHNVELVLAATSYYQSDELVEPDVLQDSFTTPASSFFTSSSLGPLFLKKISVYFSCLIHKKAIYLTCH